MSDRTCSRVVISVLHCFISIAYLFVFLYTLLMSNSKTDCFPPFLNRQGSSVPFDPYNGEFSYFCDVIIYSSAFASVLHLFMCLFVNCSWRNPGVIILNLFATLITALVTTFGAAAFTLYIVIWCDNLTHWTSVITGHNCKGSAIYYDSIHNTDNMTQTIEQMKVREYSTWSIIPLAVIIITTYAIALGTPTRSHHDNMEPQYHYVTLKSEDTPLLQFAATGHLQDNGAINLNPTTNPTKTTNTTPPKTIYSNNYNHGASNHSTSYNNNVPNPIPSYNANNPFNGAADA